MGRVFIVLGILIGLGAVGFGVLFALRNLGPGPHEKPSQIGSQPVTQTERTKDPFEQGFDKEAATSDPFADPNGPFYHNVKLATSSDGINFTDTGRIILEKASVPDVVKLQDGTILIYAVDGARRSNSQIMVARSKDGGKTWQTASVQLKSKRKIAQGVDPEVVLMPDGKIRLFYIVNPENLPPKEAGKPKPVAGFRMLNKIYSAISSDGVNFVEDLGPLYEGEEITDPDVIKIGDLWFAYISKGPKNILAIAGSDFQFQYKKDIREQGSVSNTIEVSPGQYRQFYCKDGISSAQSTDGITWQNETVSLQRPPAGKIICDPAPVKVGDKWFLFYKEGPAR